MSFRQLVESYQLAPTQILKDIISKRLEVGPYWMTNPNFNT